MPVWVMILLAVMAVSNGLLLVRGIPRDVFRHKARAVLGDPAADTTAALTNFQERIRS